MELRDWGKKLIIWNNLLNGQHRKLQIWTNLVKHLWFYSQHWVRLVDHTHYYNNSVNILSMKYISGMNLAHLEQYLIPNLSNEQYPNTVNRYSIPNFWEDISAALQLCIEHLNPFLVTPHQNTQFWNHILDVSKFELKILFAWKVDLDQAWN